MGCVNDGPIVVGICIPAKLASFAVDILAVCIPNRILSAEFSQSQIANRKSLINIV